jgi:hypothetical protein
MFVRYFLELPLPAEQVEEAVTRSPDAWMPGLARETGDAGRRLLGEVGFGERGRIDRTVELRFGEPIRIPSKTILPIEWHAAQANGLFPALEADLEVAPIGPHITQLALSARYDPPLGTLGRAIDRALLHRVAEATLKDFLDRVAAALTAQVTADAPSP